MEVKTIDNNMTPLMIPTSIRMEEPLLLSIKKAAKEGGWDFYQQYVRDVLKTAVEVHEETHAVTAS